MTDVKFQYISWEQFHEDCLALSRKIQEDYKKFDRIICISRGGLVVARILSDTLSLPVSNFTIVSYATIGIAKEPRVVEELGVNIFEENVLIVDEIVDRGDTLKVAIDYIRALKPETITSCSPYIKPAADPKPDLYISETDKWVIFPYELTETSSELIKLGYSEQDIASIITPK
jgi:hypoxanthine phosphoribosyltransferase